MVSKSREAKTQKRKLLKNYTKYPKDFVYELTSYGNPKPGTDDKADAVVVALAGMETLNENDMKLIMENWRRNNVEFDPCLFKMF